MVELRKTKRIALAGISSAFATIFVIMSAYVPLLDMSCMVLASLAILLPIAKEEYVGAGMAYLASSILSLLMTGNIVKVLPFIAFFGLHPIVLSLVQRYRLPLLIGYAVKLVFCNLAIFIAWRFLGLTVDISNFHFPYYMLALVGSVGFLLYDWLIMKIKSIFSYYIDRLVNRPGRRKRR